MGDAGAFEFRAVIRDAGGGGAYIEIPFDVEAAFGRKRVKVRATFDGVPYRGSIVSMGGARPMLGILKAIRARIGKSLGDEVSVALAEDVETREVAIPEDLARAFEGAPEAAAFFAALSYTGRREYVLWIEAAKLSATRKARIGKAIDLLREGKRPD